MFAGGYSTNSRILLSAPQSKRTLVLGVSINYCYAICRTILQIALGTTKPPIMIKGLAYVPFHT